MKNLTRQIIKLGVTGATVAGIGWAIISFYPTDEGTLEVQESEADILDLSMLDRTASEKIGRSLERMGHEPPRVYDMNGNTVMFSTSTFPGKTPDSVLRDYQRVFTEEELNTRMYTKPVYELARLGSAGANAEIKDLQDAAMNGEVVPQLVSKEGFTMGSVMMDLEQAPRDAESKMRDKLVQTERAVDMFGSAYTACAGDEDVLQRMRETRSTSPLATINAKVDKAAQKNAGECGGDGGICSPTRVAYTAAKAELDALQRAVSEQPGLRQCQFMRNAAKAAMETSKDDFTEKVQGFSSIEGFYNAEKNITHVTATWTDEKFDAKKANPARYGALDESDTRSPLPLCQGCLRSFDFAGTGGEDDYSSGQIISPKSARMATQEYLTVLTNDGWQVADSSIATNEIMRLSGRSDDSSQWIRVRRGKHKHMTVRIAPLPNGGSRISGNATN